MIISDINGNDPNIPPVSENSHEASHSNTLRIMAADLVTLAISPKEMMDAIAMTGKKSSYVWRLWKGASDLPLEKQKELFLWRMNRCIEGIKNHFGDENILGSCKFEANSKLQTMFDKYWNMIDAYYNSGDKEHPNVRNFIMFYRANLFNKILELDRYNHKLTWLTYMARLETIGLEDGYFIRTGLYAFKVAYLKLGETEQEETLNVLLNLSEDRAFKKYSSQANNEPNWRWILNEGRTLSDRFYKKRQSRDFPTNLGVIGDNIMSVNPTFNDPVNIFGYDHLWHRKKQVLDPDAKPFYKPEENREISHRYPNAYNKVTTLQFQ